MFRAPPRGAGARHTSVCGRQALSINLLSPLQFDAVERWGSVSPGIGTGAGTGIVSRTSETRTLQFVTGERWAVTENGTGIGTGIGT